MLIGLDVGGTHTDAVLLEASTARCLAAVKALTRPEDISQGVIEALRALMAGEGAYPAQDASAPARPAPPSAIRRVCVSSTLGLNALLTGKADPTGMLAVPGPGIDPCLLWGDDPDFHVLAGAQDHRGKVIAAPDGAEVHRALSSLRDKNIQALGVVAKFSPKNPDLEHELAAAARDMLGPESIIVQGAEASGSLNFPRRLHTAWCNAALGRISRSFIAALGDAMQALSLTCPLVILKADAGVFSAGEAARDPAGTMGSGPAASLLGVWALSRDPGTAASPVSHTPKAVPSGDTVMVDMGGTTTDLALLAGGEPLLAPNGLTAAGRPTLVRALWTRSIALGGDSSLRAAGSSLSIGPDRIGPALALGSAYPAVPDRSPTLTDALNLLGLCRVGDVALSRAALEALFTAVPADLKKGMASAEDMARAFARQALLRIRAEMELLLAEVNALPVYTIRELLVQDPLRPAEAVFIGGPAAALAGMAEECWGLPVRVPDMHACANAVGAALARPTRAAELYADTQLGRMTIPDLGIAGSVDRGYLLDQAKQDLLRALAEAERAQETPGGQEAPAAQIVFAESFLMLDDAGRRGRILRVRAQLPAGLMTG